MKKEREWIEKILASVYKPEDVLTEKQQEIVSFILLGKSVKEILEIEGCSRQNIYSMMDDVIHRMGSGKPVRKRRERKPKTEKPQKTKKIKTQKPKMKVSRQKIDYEKYINCDLSLLTESERKILMSVVKLKSNKEVAEKLGVSYSYITKTLISARAKLENDKEKIEKIKNREASWQKKHYENLPDEERGKRLIKQKERRKEKKIIAESMMSNQSRNIKIDYSKSYDLTSLTEKEKDIFNLMAELKDKKEVAKRLGISDSNVGSRIHGIKIKLVISGQIGK